MSQPNEEYDMLKTLYGESIENFLKDSDMASVTSKKVRKHIEAQFNVNLEPFKKNISKLIEDYFLSLHDNTNKEEEEEEEDSDLSDVIEDGRPRKALKIKNGKKVTKTKKKEKKIKSKEKEKKTPTMNRPKKLNGFNAPHDLSKELAEIVGATRLPRTSVIKKLWEYIKSNKLQDPSDGRNILCDEKFKTVFKVNVLSSFQMSKLIGPHLIKLSKEELDKIQEEMDREFELNKSKCEDADENENGQDDKLGGENTTMEDCKEIEPLLF